MKQHWGVLRKTSAFENYYNHGLRLLFPRVIFSNVFSPWSAHNIMRQFGNKSLLRRLRGNSDFCEGGPTRATTIPASSSKLPNKSCPWDAGCCVRTEIAYWNHIRTSTFLVRSLRKKHDLYKIIWDMHWEMDISTTNPFCLPFYHLPPRPSSRLLTSCDRDVGNPVALHAGARGCPADCSRVFRDVRERNSFGRSNSCQGRRENKHTT